MPPTYERKPARQRLQVTADPETGLPALTDQQEQFVHALLSGKNQSDAYRAAYNTANMRPESIAVNASKLRADTKIAHTLRYFQRMGVSRAAVTVEGHLQELERGRELAYVAGQISAGVQAEHYRGKVSGFYEDKLRVTSGQSDAALLTALTALLGPDAASTIADQLDPVQVLVVSDDD